MGDPEGQDEAEDLDAIVEEEEEIPPASDDDDDSDKPESD